MKANNNHIDIRTIKLYLQGKLPAEQKRAMDEWRASDPFLDAAIAGYENVPGSFKGYTTFKNRYKKGGYGYWYIGSLTMVLIVAAGFWLFEPAASVAPVPASQSITPALASDSTTQVSLAEKNKEKEQQTTSSKKEAYSQQESENRSVNHLAKDSLYIGQDELGSVESAEDAVVETSVKKEVPEKKEEVIQAATALDVTVYYLYTREYIMNTYLASTGRNKNSYTQKGKEELDQLKSHLQKNQLKKAVGLIHYGNFSKENAKAMNEWIEVLALVENKEYEAARKRLNNIELEYPLPMQPTINKLYGELKKIQP